MQRWQLTTGLAAITVLAAFVVPSLPGLLGQAPAEPPTPPAPQPPTPAAPPASTGVLALDARLDQAALLQGSGEDRYLVVEVSAPQMEGDVRRPVHVAVVMDVSGSMAGRGKIDNARMAAAEMIDLLGPQDSFSLVTFSDRARVVIPSAPTGDGGSFRRLVNGISPGGGTNLYDGLAQGLSELDDPELNGVKRVVILSDGMANIGITDPASLARAAGSKVREGTTVSALGLGLDFNEDLLAAMSDAGGGRYRFVDRPGMLTEMFAQELQQMTAVAGREASVEVHVPGGVQVVEVYGYDASLTNDGYRVFLGDVHGGETRKVVARLRVPDREVGTLEVADVELRYTDASSGNAAVASLDVTTEVTRSTALAAASVDRRAKKQAVRAHAGKLLDEGARAWSSGDLATNEARLREGEELLSALGAEIDDADVQSEAESFRSQRAAFQAAPPASDAGVYQVKKAKEQARDGYFH